MHITLLIYVSIVGMHFNSYRSILGPSEICLLEINVFLC